MTVLYVIGTILRFLLRIALLPVQAALTLMLLAIDFASGLIGIAFIVWALANSISHKKKIAKLESTLI